MHPESSSEVAFCQERRGLMERRFWHFQGGAQGADPSGGRVGCGEAGSGLNRALALGSGPWAAAARVRPGSWERSPVRILSVFFLFGHLEPTAPGVLLGSVGPGSALLWGFPCPLGARGSGRQPRPWRKFRTDQPMRATGRPATVSVTYVEHTRCRWRAARKRAPGVTCPGSHLG